MRQATIRAASPNAKGGDLAQKSAWAQELAERGVQRFQDGDFQDAVRLIEAALRLEESAERWNDWAAAQLARANPAESEHGFRRALQMDPGHNQAAANLGVLLASQGRNLEAIHYLESALAGLAADPRRQVNSILARCRFHIANLGNDDAAR